MISLDNNSVGRDMTIYMSPHLNLRYSTCSRDEFIAITLFDNKTKKTKK